MPIFYSIGRAMIDIYLSLLNIPSKFQSDKPIYLSKDELDSVITLLTKNGQKKVQSYSGGIAANIVKTAASLGAKTFFSGTIGTDANGRFFEQDLAKYKVCTFFDLKHGNTGRKLTLVASKPSDKTNLQNLINPESSLDISPIQIRTPYLSNSDCVITESSLMQDAPLWQKIISDCLDYKKTLLISISSQELCESVALQIIQLVKQIPLIISGTLDEIQLINDFFKKNGTSLEHLTSLSDNYESPLILGVGSNQSSKVWFEGNCVTSSATYTKNLSKSVLCECFTGSFITRWFSIGNIIHDRRKNQAVITECLDFATEFSSTIKDNFSYLI